MMAQYRRIKEGLPPDTLLLFRLGDFYELFYEDARIGAEVLQIALTKRGQAPMCGIPYHAAGSYISRLLRAGYRVAICEQIEEPRPGRLVRREVTQILSPGAHFDERLLVGDRHNFLCAVSRVGRYFGLAVLELTTGEFYATEVDEMARFEAELTRWNPSEVIEPEGQQIASKIQLQSRPWVHQYDAWAFSAEAAQQALREQFRISSLEGIGLRGRPAAMVAAGAIVQYLKHELRQQLDHVINLHVYQSNDYLQIDPHTLRNLEVLEPLNREAPSEACLFGVLNRCVTPMGGRLLRQWLTRPLKSVELIRQRQTVIEAFLRAPDLLESVRNSLKGVRDLERIICRIGARQASPRDLVWLREALRLLPTLQHDLRCLIYRYHRDELWTKDLQLCGEINKGLTSKDLELLSQIADRILPQPELLDLLDRALVEDPPTSMREGGVFRSGFNDELDRLREAAQNGKKWIAEFQQREIERTGIQSLKVGYNAVFGYYIEVTKPNLSKVPPDYERKQTLANAERFVTPELKEMEAKVLGAEERASQLENHLFQELLDRVRTELKSLQDTAHALATVDVLSGLAEVARLHNYCRPEVKDEGILLIKEGRHPVLEVVQGVGRFVPNDTELTSEVQIMLITGPNMAGKSTYIRQVALIALMAHIGSFVPARTARVDLLDRIFTRIGASDDLARGQSTFMVEMSEMAEILRYATPRSLVILDEVGRGTSTFDGLSIAWSIVEYLHDHVGAKTLFATHYHELTELENRLRRVRNYNIAVREYKGQIIFLHRIIEGPSDRSYGIQVARLAGVPEPVIERAKEILWNLERSELQFDSRIGRRSRLRQQRAAGSGHEEPEQLDLFSFRASWADNGNSG